jgi:hypothetical protein
MTTPSLTVIPSSVNFNAYKMTDITKCTGEVCALKQTCYRFTAPMGTYQSMFVEVPIRNGKCDYYWETFNTKEK